VRRITGLPALTKRRLKSALKSYVVPAATLLDAHPVFKSTLRRAFRPFPGFHARLARAARPSVVMATGGAKIESVPEVQPRDLAPTARRVYQDLLDARTERSKRQDTHAEA
jgi:hypothetical protein